MSEYAAEAEVVRDAVRRAESRRAVTFNDDYTPPPGVTVQVRELDESLQTIDLEHLDTAPREVRGDATLYDPESFTVYVERLHSAATTLWATMPTPSTEGRPARPGRAGTITAVFNDHAAAGLPGWRDSRATLLVQDDPDWAAWARLDGKLIGQKDFAQFLLDHAHNIRTPSPAKLMPAVLQFQAARNAKYESGVNLDNGEVRMQFVEDIKQSNQGRQSVALPQTITLALYPFAGAVEAEAAFDVEARIRYRIPADGGELAIGYKLTRPDHVVLQAWERLTGEIRADLPEGVVLLQGVPPTALRGPGA